MTNDSFFSSPTIDLNVENPTITVRESSIHKNDSAIPVSQHQEQKPSSSYVTLSVGDNRRFGLSDFQDPLFYQQPLHFHYNQPIPSTVESGYETGDRARATNEIIGKKYRKRKSISSSRKDNEQSKSTYQQPNSSSKPKKKMVTAAVKAKEKKKKKNASTGRVCNRTSKSKRANRSCIQQLRPQSKNRRQALLKRHRQQKRLLKKKKKLLKQHIVSKKRSMSKKNTKESFISAQHDRKLNMTNNRVASTISPHGSLTSGVKSIRSINQSKVGTTGVESVIKHHASTPTNILSSPVLHSTLPSKVSSTTKLGQKSSKKNLLHSRLNVREVAISKSKRAKQQNRVTKLNIRSPTHTAFKKKIRRYRQRRSTRRKEKFPRCTSKTLITIAPINTTDKNIIKSISLNNENTQTRTSPSLILFNNSLNDQRLSTSTVMPLTTNSAQLTSKNNNDRGILTIKRPQSRSATARLNINKRSTKTETALRSRAIITNKVTLTKRKGKKHKRQHKI